MSVPRIGDARALAGWLGEQFRRGARRFELMRRRLRATPTSLFEIVELSPDPLAALADDLFERMHDDHRRDPLTAHAVYASAIGGARPPDAIAFLVREPTSERVRIRLDEARLWRNVALKWLAPREWHDRVDTTLNAFSDAEARQGVEDLNLLRLQWQTEWVLRP